MSEGMDRMQKGQVEARRQHHISVLLVFNRDYFPSCTNRGGAIGLHM